LWSEEVVVMLFSDEQIALARQMREHGLPWRPAVGHYVLDETELIEIPSPFQQRVYYILDMKHFLRRAGSVEALTDRMLWLPQWHQAREIAREMGISDAAVARQVADETVFAANAELSALYRLILSALRTGGGTVSVRGARAGTGDNHLGDPSEPTEP
jgi:hypothetical protein